MRHLLIFLIFITLGIATIPSFSAAQDDYSSLDDAPYMYYFTPLLNAFVIERADGTDSRIFGENIMPVGTDLVSGAGWSPSGKWFAWTATIYSRTEIENYKPYILSVDGQTQVELPYEIQNAFIVWSSNQDLLFIEDIDMDTYTGGGFAKTRLYVVNPAENTVNLLGEFEYAEFYGVYWFDQQGIAMVNVELANRYMLTALIFDGNGIVQEKEIPYQFGLRDFNYKYTLSPTGYVVYGNGNGTLTFQNLLTDEIKNIEWIDFDIRNVVIEWNSEGSHATIFNEKDLYLYSITQDSLEFLHDNVEAARHYPYWSPDGQTAIFIVGQQYYQTKIADISVEPIIISNYSELPHHPASLSWTWISNHQIATEYLNWEPEVKVVEVYDIKTKKITTRDVNWPVFVTFSTDGQYFVAMNGLSRIEVYTLHSDEFYEVMPHSATAWEGALIETRWHPTTYWAMSYQQYASNYFQGMVQVFNLDGSIRRELTACFANDVCSNWLPAQVDINQLRQGQPKPILGEPVDIIHTSNWVANVSWSPSGKEIATLSGWPLYAIPAELGQLSVWDIETYEEISFTEINGSDYYDIQWELVDDVYLAVAHKITLRFEEIRTAILEYPLATHPNNTQQIFIDPDDPNWNNVVIRDIETNAILLKIEGNKVAYSADGQYLAVGGAFSQVRILDTATWEELAVLNVYTGGLDFSPNDQYLAVGSSWDVQIWDMTDLLSNK